MPWSLADFSALVSQMRTAQRDYFRNRKRATPQDAQALLAHSTWLEREVDKALTEIATDMPLFNHDDEPF
jgi:hypothetical protein